jgi:gluconolactonase
MRLTGLLAIVALMGSAISYGQLVPPAGRRTGPGVQAAQDEKEPDVLKTCKVPPPAPAGGGRGPGRGGPPPAQPERDYTVTEIPGIIAAGQKWKVEWTTEGNNADGIIATKDGGLLIAQNDNSKIVKLKDGKATDVYSGLNTSGAVSQNTKGVLFVNNRGLRASIDILAPKKAKFADNINGDSLDCLGGVLNDLTADSKGGVYFTQGGLFYADPKGKVTRYGDNLRTNGIILSPDEKVLYVTNGGTIAAFDVQKDGSLTNQREFVKLQGENVGGDGSTVDSKGNLYVTTNPGIQVITPQGKLLGVIPTPRGTITTAFAGKDKKTLYAVISVLEGNPPTRKPQIISIPMLSQGFKGRAK